MLFAFRAGFAEPNNSYIVFLQINNKLTKMTAEPIVGGWFVQS